MAATCSIYCRISRDKTGLGTGVERQESDCRDLAKRLGWEVREVFVDNDLSASTYSKRKRPQYERLLARIEAGEVKGVVAWHPDRLHRQPTELERYIALAEQHGVTTHTVQAGQWDLSTPAGRLNARTVGNFAAYEAEHRSERVKAAAKQRAARGGWSGGRRCYGWEPDGKTPRESEAAELRAAAEQIAAGVSLRAIVADLNTRGVKTTTGRKPWVSTTLRDTLMAPRHAGYVAYHGEIQETQADWPAIIPPDLWHAVQTVLNDESRRTNYVGGTVKWLGSLLYRCGVCGSSEHMRARVTTGGRKRYRCGNRIKGDPVTHVGRDARLLDRLVENLIVARLSQPEVIEALSPGVTHVDMESLRNELADNRARLTEAADLYATRSISAAQLASITATLNARIADIEAEMASGVSDSPLAVFATAEDPALIWFGAGGPDGDRSGGLPLGIKRDILRKLCDVTIHPAPSGPFRPEFITVDWRTSY